MIDSNEHLLSISSPGEVGRRIPRAPALWEFIPKQKSELL